MKLLVATTNAHKVREIRPLLVDPALEILTLADLAPVPAPDEGEPTFWQNARLKALYYARTTGHTVVAEDSGLEVAGLDGAPGVHSARFLGRDVSYAERFAAIARQLEAQPAGARAARFVTALACVAGEQVRFETEAWIDGEIARRPTGTHGFGYDPIFLYPPLRRTTAELTLAEKSAVSHRARAFRDFARWIRSGGLDARA